MFAFALPKEANASDPLAGGCPSGVDCFAYGVRVGLQAQYSFSTSGVFRPWLGIGVGYEWLQVQLEGEVLGFPIDWTTGHSGPDLLHFQGGLDTSMGNAGRVGPFVGASAMQYSACSADLGETSPGCKIAQAGWHGWVVLGLRGALRL